MVWGNGNLATPSMYTCAMAEYLRIWARTAVAAARQATWSLSRGNVVAIPALVLASLVFPLLLSIPVPTDSFSRVLMALAGVLLAGLIVFTVHVGYSVLRTPFVLSRQQAQEIDVLHAQNEDVRSQLQSLLYARPLLVLGDPILFPRETFDRRRRGLTPTPGSLFRIKVANKGEGTAYGVSVRVTNSDPPIRGNLSTPLMLTDDRQNPPSREFDLPPGDINAVNVDVAHTESDRPGTIFLDSAIPDWDGNLQGTRFRLSITVSAKTDSVPVTKSYVVGAAAKWIGHTTSELTMVELEVGEPGH
ncbi:MAG: hypothetical protein HW416_3059 [Chloroflexi bacterium]|nr:hypothetical protein [Chloroflexota bacterium]